MKCRENIRSRNRNDFSISEKHAVEVKMCGMIANLVHIWETGQIFGRLIQGFFLKKN